jgi:hypothetical protein
VHPLLRILVDFLDLKLSYGVAEAFVVMPSFFFAFGVEWPAAEERLLIPALTLSRVGGFRLPSKG